MKRSPELAPLSRDHHQALEVALRLRRADGDTADAAVARFGDFWRGAGERHFRIEEAVLLPALPADDPEWAEATARVRREHDEIRGRADALLAAPAERSVDPVRELGELLNDHVRYEERYLFALLEERLSSAQLGDLGRGVAAAEQA